MSAAGVQFDNQFSVKLDNGETLTADRLLVAAGRRTDMAALGIGAMGLDESARGVETDERMRAAEGLWAIGDITGRGAFTHMSMYQARIAAADILGEDDPETADYRAVPRVTFTDPEIGSVGLSEAAARERGLTVRTGIVAHLRAPRAGSSTRSATTGSSSSSRTPTAACWSARRRRARRRRGARRARRWRCTRRCRPGCCAR